MISDKQEFWRMVAAYAVGVALVAVVIISIFVVACRPGIPKPNSENWVEVQNRIERENNQAAISSCLKHGGVPIFSSTWHSKITDCKFPPAGREQ